MKVFVIAAFLGLAMAAPQASPATLAAPAAPPTIDWGKCSQLKPSDTDRQSKAAVVEKCVQENPVPQAGQATEEAVMKHRETVTTCALQKEGWFDASGVYKFDRARDEIKNKKLESALEASVLEKHESCKKEAGEKHTSDYIKQVQLYQACMDFNISQICGIKVVPA